MKILYLDCAMGAAGDMLSAALLMLHPDPDAVVARLNALGLPGVRFCPEKAEKCGITGLHIAVQIDGCEEDCAQEVHTPAQHAAQDDAAHAHHHHHAHTGLQQILQLISGLELPACVREDMQAVYRLIAEAESQVHGETVSQIHFHEVGSLDAVADVAAVCLLLHELAPEQIVASPVHVGSGQVRCAHGILPVPAPATALLLQGIPTYGGQIQGELCTPTGAALLRHFVQHYGPQPVMCVEKIGYGCGKKDFAQANCVRALLGEQAGAPEQIWELRCNLDDMTPEALGYAQQRLLEAGALDVYTAAIGMKKNRPAVLLGCLCTPAQKETMLRLLFQHTTTLGVRMSLQERCTLARSARTLQTEDGPVRIKTASGWGTLREKAEYEDVAAIAQKRGISLQQAAQLVAQADARAAKP